MMPRPVHMLAATSAVLLALSSCDATDTSTPQASTSPAPSPTTDATAAETQRAVALPEIGQCRMMSPKKVADPEYFLDDSPVVPCSAQHVTETAAVYPLHEATVEAATEYAGLCETAANAYAGGVFGEVPSFMGIFMFLPSQRQVDQGHAWARCDVSMVADTHFTRANPTTGSLKDAVDRHPAALWGCLDEMPDAARSQPLVSCKEPHLTELTVTLMRLDRLERYPSAKVLAREGESQCADDLAAQPNADQLRIEPHWDIEERMIDGDTLLGGCWLMRKDGKPMPAMQ